ncbi:MAG: hypothetical protein A2Y56_06250, partial [Candidatus Aminicenantes bacterium RBG_13_63_10]
MKKLFTLLIACALCLPVLVWAAAEEGYYSRSYARLNYVSGDAYVQRAGDLGFEAGVVNLPASEGDKLGTREGRAEIQFGGRNYLRVDRLTQVEFVNLPQQDTDPYKLHLLSGSLYLRVGSLVIDKGFEVHTPDASFYVLEEGLYRVNLIGGAQTELQVISGSCEAAGEGGSVVVGAGQRIVASNGQLRSQPEAFASVQDEFARWSESREALLAQNSSSSYLSGELAEYGSEFDEYGTWSYEPSYGYVWVPQTSYNDWRPYYYGHWVWYPIIGWTWVSDEPWGWCAYHYGRWHWGHHLGWYWIPTSYWGPAWVNWWWDNDYLGWCPLSYYNRPVVIINNNFYANYNNDYFPVENRALTMISRNQLQSPRVSDVALGRDRMERMDQIRLSDRQPGITPSVDRGGKVFRDGQKVFSAAAGRKVDRAFGSNEFNRGSLNRTTSGSAIRERSSVDRETFNRSGAVSSRSGETRSSGTMFRETQGRNIRSYPSSGSDSRSGSVRSTLPERSSRTGTSSDSRVRSYSSAREGTSGVRRTDSTSGGNSARTVRRDFSSSSSSGSGRAIREYRSNGSSPVSRFRSASATGSSTRSSSSRQSEGWTARTSDRSYRSGSVSGSVTRNSSSGSSSGSRGEIRSYSSPSRSTGSSSRSSSSSSRSYNPSSRSSSGSSQSYSSPSRSYSAPSRSYSSPSRSSSGSSRSYSSPSRSSSGSSRSYSSPSRSSSSSSRSSSSSSRSSS